MARLCTAGKPPNAHTPAGRRTVAQGNPVSAPLCGRPGSPGRETPGQD